MVHVLLQPRGIAPAFLKSNSWLPVKRYNIFFNRWVQFRVRVIPRLPQICPKTYCFPYTLPFKGGGYALSPIRYEMRFMKYIFQVTNIVFSRQLLSESDL